MDFYVDYTYEENNETGRTKLTVSDFDATSIRDIKYAIQAAIQAPVCDQQLFYQGQPVTDDDMTLSRLYFREGDCFKVQFLAAADIARISELVDVLKNSAQEIVEKLNRQPPSKLATEDNSDGLSLRFYNQLVSAIIGLCYSLFLPWKQLRTVAQRHFFVQEGGFDAFLEVFKFSQRLNLVEDDINLGIPMEVVMQQHSLSGYCLNLLWNFAETREDQQFILSKGVFPLIIDALLLQPGSLRDYESSLAVHTVIGVNEAAIGCCSGLVEYDANIQEEVSKMPSLIDKLLFITDRCQSEPAGYSLSASQAASNALFHCTYNVKSAQPLMDCGALGKMVNITKELLIDKDSDTPLRYYCCLFLARLRSAPLIKLDRDTCVAIDELIDLFLDSHVPDEMSKLEEEMYAIWMTIIPLVHLAFAAGKEYYLSCSYGNNQDDNQIKDQKYGNNVHGTHQSEEACFMESKLPTNSIPDVHNAGMADMKKAPSGYRLSNSDSREEKLSDIHVSESVESTTSLYITKDCVIAGQKDQFLWPGSTSTQKLGVFSLVHTLSIKENLQIALSENLLPYLVCLSWRLNFDERVKLSTGLSNFHNVSVPSLKVAAKSVLATVYGFDMVSNL